MNTTNQNRPLAAEKTLKAQELYSSGDVRGALVLFGEAWVHCNDAIGAMNLAIALEHLGQFDDAFAWAEKAYAMRPEDMRVRICYGSMLQREGRWIEGWKHWFPVIENPFSGGGEEWKPGMDLEGKEVLIVPAGGYGDVFMLARLIPEVARRFKCRVSFAPNEDMVPVFLRQPSMANVNMQDKRKWQVWMHLFHLPQLLELTPGMVRDLWTGPYIEPIELEESAEIRVGLKLEAGEKGDPYRFRSVPGIVGDQLLNGIPATVTKIPLTMSNPMVHGWLDTIALISTCDLILSVDTSVLHLAAAMGKETWALLGDFNDAKFGRKSVTPWYPTMKIFRGEGKGYQHTVDQVLHEFGIWLLNSKEAPLPRRYNVAGTIATTSSSMKSALAIIATAAVRPTIYDFSVGMSGTPADNSSQWQVIRMSGTVGTSTASTPAALDFGDPGATASGAQNYTAEQGTAGNVIFGPLDLNIRATYRWVAAPGGELIAPPTAANSLNLRGLSSAYTGVLDATVHYWE